MTTSTTCGRLSTRPPNGLRQRATDDAFAPVVRESPNATMTTTPTPTPIVFAIPTINLPLESARETPNHAAVRARWQASFPGAAQSESVDREEFFELANAYFALVGAAVPYRVAIGDVPQSEANTIYLGRYRKHSFCVGADHDALDGFRWPDLRAVRCAEQWYEQRAFRDAAGRWIGVFDIPAEDGCGIGAANSLPSALSVYARDADRDVFLKVVSHAKYGCWKVHIPRGTSPKNVWDIILGELEYTVVHLAGSPRAILASAWTDLRYEYRLIVIDGQVVAGAGCIDAMDPYFAVETPFDPQMETYRNCGEIARLPALAQSYAAFGYELAARAVREQATMRHYTLDLALNPQGRIVVVECNPTLNFGLYCARYEHILPAILRACEPSTASPSRRAERTLCPEK